jgi:hypothetical protein
VTPLAVVLSLSLFPKLAESQVNATAINGVQWGARLALSQRLSWISWGLGTTLT